MTARVTTVVMTRDRRDDLRRSLPRHAGPVILVDNGSTDGTVGMVRREHPEVDVVELGKNRGAVARNLGVAAAGTPYVAFADDDSWWAPGALDRAADVLDAHPRLALLAARILVGQQESLDPVCALMATSPLPRCGDLPGPPVLGFVACGAVVRREAFLEAGGFDDVVQFSGEEDRVALDLAAAGWGLAYVDDVVAHHHPSTRRPPSATARVRMARNRLLTAVMRRPWPTVAATVPGLVAAWPEGARGVAAAVPRLPRALSRRRVVPPAVEASRRLLD